MPKLSPRLDFLFQALLKKQAVWDLCCDHGLLGLAAWQSQQFTEVHFVDQVPHIMADLERRFWQQFQRQTAELQNSTLAKFYQLPAEKIDIPVYGTLVVAGVGAGTIIKILTELQGRQVLLCDRLVLSPHRDIKAFAQFFAQQESLNQFQLHSEKSIDERGRERQIFIFDRQN